MVERRDDQRTLPHRHGENCAGELEVGGFGRRDEGDGGKDDV